MGKKLIPLLSGEAIQELEKTYRQHPSHAVRLRCHLVLLKHQGHSSQYISSLAGYPKHQGSINGWIKRYQTLGLAGLKNKSGQGRKPILSLEEHQHKVKEIVQSERQRLSYAKCLLEKELKLQMSKKTLTRFLKTLTGSINVSEKG